MSSMWRPEDYERHRSNVNKNSFDQYTFLERDKNN